MVHPCRDANVSSIKPSLLTILMLRGEGRFEVSFACFMFLWMARAIAIQSSKMKFISIFLNKEVQCIGLLLLDSREFLPVYQAWFVEASMLIVILMNLHSAFYMFKCALQGMNEMRPNHNTGSSMPYS